MVPIAPDGTVVQSSDITQTTSSHRAKSHGMVNCLLTAGAAVWHPNRANVSEIDEGPVEDALSTDHPAQDA